MKHLLVVLAMLPAIHSQAQTDNPGINSLLRQYLQKNCDSPYIYSWHNTNQSQPRFAECRCELYQWKGGLSYAVKSDPLTEADSLNGLTFKGTVTITGHLYRTFYVGGTSTIVQVTTHSYKSEWKKTTEPFYLLVEQREGKWTGNLGGGGWGIYPISKLAPTCADIQAMKRMDKAGEFNKPGTGF